LVAAGDRREEGPLPQVTRVVHATVRGGVDLDHVDRARPVVAQRPAGLALPTRIRGGSPLAVERPGQNPGRRGLAAPAGAGEEVRVVEPTGAQRLDEWFGDVL